MATLGRDETMKAYIKNQDTTSLLDEFSKFEVVDDFINANSDVGFYYSPHVVRGHMFFYTTDTRQFAKIEYLRVEFPNSTLEVRDDVILVNGMRGSVEDCIEPILTNHGINVDSPRWVVKTTRPDVPWYRRTAEYRPDVQS
jgi:hypothetical protein